MGLVLVGARLTHWGRDKWTPFRRRYFQPHFLEWKCLNSDENFTGDKPLSEPRMVSLPTHICVTRPQWVNGNDGWHLPQQIDCSADRQPSYAEKIQIRPVPRFGPCSREQIRTCTNDEMMVCTQTNFEGPGVFVGSRQALILYGI